MTTTKTNPSAMKNNREMKSIADFKTCVLLLEEKKSQNKLSITQIVSAS